MALRCVIIIVGLFIFQWVTDILSRVYFSDIWYEPFPTLNKTEVYFCAFLLFILFLFTQIFHFFPIELWKCFLEHFYSVSWQDSVHFLAYSSSNKNNNLVFLALYVCKELPYSFIVQAQNKIYGLPLDSTENFILSIA